MDERRLIREALTLLDVDHFVLGIHDVSFPGDADEDLGRGSPYSRGAERFFDFIAQLGFDGVQFGPQGATHPGSPSPYEATLFSRSPLNLPVRQLLEEGLLRRSTLDRLLERRPDGALRRMPYAFVLDAYQQLQSDLLVSDGPQRYAEALRRFRTENEWWLLGDGLYEPLCRLHQRPWWREWGHSAEGRLDQELFAPTPGSEARTTARLQALRHTWAHALEKYAFVQLLLTRSHRSLRDRAGELGLSLYGDLQVGFSAQDSWAFRRLFLSDYRMGAPPSRTNPEGQPWGYDVLDPAQHGTSDDPGPALAFVRARVRKVLEDFDGVRIDHPHGWIDPWVYRADDPDPLHAVQSGARLFSSPDLPDHPALAPFSVVAGHQLRRELPRYADEWISSLSPQQADRYARLVDVIVDEAQQQNGQTSKLVCEVLSTLPCQVREVLSRHRLGRFRVTQKANLDDPKDVYRSENAAAEDWIMLGNHDTPSIWRVIDRWSGSGQLERRAAYLAERLASSSPRRAELRTSVLSNPGAAANAQLADALASQARNVFVFWTDLFGLKEPYNTPGEVSSDNWTLRVPHDFEAAYRSGRAGGGALDLRRACALALRARGGADQVALATRLEEAIARARP